MSISSADRERRIDPVLAVLHPVRDEYFGRSHTLHRVLAGLMLVCAMPVVLVLAALVKLASRGPAIYAQRRVGRHGKTFFVYKLRTMRVDAEAASGPVWATANDPRVNSLGRFLRATHLDELPQLWNVVRGEMSLVGPRPERPEFTHRLAREIPGYLNRLVTLPGITGLAQINLPPDSDIDSVRRKLLLDLEYVHTAGWSMDLRILCCTGFRLLYLSSRGIRRLLGVYRNPSCLAGESQIAIKRFTSATNQGIDDEGEGVLTCLGQR